MMMLQQIRKIIQNIGIDPHRQVTATMAGDLAAIIHRRREIGVIF
jgi:hypothetical protein